MTSPTRRSTPNRLGGETSPYLLQHAYNPVDWYPWGPEALELSRLHNKPIFLSIGYSACHWCHVMEHESFEDPELSALLNERFINIKVDREERPDLDQIYMQAVQLITGRGGWPMSVFLTPGLEPFYGGTYWPPTRRGGMPGFRDVLDGVFDAWTKRPDEVQNSATKLTTAIQSAAALDADPQDITPDLLRQAGRTLCRQADRQHGGFGRAPKFPHAMDLRVLLRCYRRFQDADALHVVRLTLDKMAAGGIYDQLGGGFHRYSTDERWLAPHFEKMLYDNALLVPVYLEAWQVTRDDNYQRIVRETLDYILREMEQPTGGYYSTQDADSEGVEGKFFVWSLGEIETLLGVDLARVFCYAYDVSGHGNWEETNILNRPKNSAQVAEVLGITVEFLEQQLAAGRKILLSHRETRIHPGRDDKVLAAWNGLMISAFARTAIVLQEPRYTTSAIRAAEFVLTHLQPAPGRLLHGFKDGQARLNAYLDDYAAVIDGLIDLHQTTQDVRWLAAAVPLAETLLEHFLDREEGAFFYTSHDHESLIARMKDMQDNATPSGNSLAVNALLRLGRLTGRTDFEAAAEDTLRCLVPLAQQYPSAAGQLLQAADFLLGPSYEIALVADHELPPWQAALASEFAPHLLWVCQQGAAAPDTPIATILQGKTTLQSQPAAYVCEHGTCREPVTTLADLRRILDV